MNQSLYQTRLKRYEDTLAGKKTDRILIAPVIMYLPLSLYGETTFQDALYDWQAAEESYLRYHREYQPDLCWGPQIFVPTNVLETLDCQYVRWPGRDFSDPNRGYQILGEEYMLQEEYLEFARDPSAFLVRKILPRHYGRLKGLSKLDFSNAVYMSGLYAMSPFADDDVQQALEALAQAGRQMKQVGAYSHHFSQRMAEEGWPMAMDTAGQVPFDLFNDNLRGLINATMDMVECPDELLLALETATRIKVEAIRKAFAARPVRTCGFFLHNGMAEFMSPQQFETFYWPGLKAVVDAVVEQGGVARLYTEGNYEPRLELLSTLPKDKVIITLIGTDMKTARSKLPGFTISGGVDASLLQYGSPEQVADNVKQVVDDCAAGGGYILDCNASLDAAKPENLRAMFETALTYGSY